jgi:NADPH:quinone reductase-like Zn-dependent oxidoreductase
MRTLRLTNENGKTLLREQESPRPRPGKGEVLIKVHAAGITPTEIGWYPTSHTRNGAKRTNPVPSHEFSGEVAECGEGVERLSIGEEVYGMNDWFADGALADYCVTQSEWFALKPASVSHAEAASIPIGALTARQGLFDRAKLQPGERVLIHGGAGSVGSFAIQMARRHGARVITTVSARNIDLAKELGAAEVIDYKSEAFEDRVRDLDVVFDTVGGETLERSWKVLRDGGRLVTIADVTDVTDERAKQAFFLVKARRMELAEIARSLDNGDLRTLVDSVIPFSDASGVYAGGAVRTGCGKLVVVIDN